MSSEEYEVESITAKRVRAGGHVFYSVKWKGFASPTWEPVSHLAHCKELIQEFEAARPAKSSIPSKRKSPAAPISSDAELKAAPEPKSKRSKTESSLKATLQKPSPKSPSKPKSPAKQQSSHSKPKSSAKQRSTSKSPVKPKSSAKQQRQTDQDVEWEVEEIVDKKLTKDGVLYKLKWRGFDEMTWEPKTAINAALLIQKFERKVADQKKMLKMRQTQ
jgi:hypothetical protein